MSRRSVTSWRDLAERKARDSPHVDDLTDDVGRVRTCSLGREVVQEDLEVAHHHELLHPALPDSTRPWDLKTVRANYSNINCNNIIMIKTTTRLVTLIIIIIIVIIYFFIIIIKRLLSHSQISDPGVTLVCRPDALVRVDPYRSVHWSKLVNWIMIVKFNVH